MASLASGSFRVIAICLCTALAQGCTDSGDDRQDPTGRVEAVIGPAGGTLEVTGADNVLAGVKVTVPAGAVAKSTRFSVEWASDGPPLPTGLSIDYPLVTFGPEATFSGYIEIALPVTYVPTGEGHILGAYCWNTAKARWVVIPARRVENDRLIVETNELGLCRWGTIRLDQVEDDTIRAWMEDLQGMFDDWEELKTALVAKLQPFIAIVENPTSFYRCASQDAALSALASWREEALQGMTAYLESAAVSSACRICDRDGTCLPAVCQADSVISGQPFLWLQEEVRIYVEELFWSSACPVDVLGPIVGKMVAWAKYQEAIRTLQCDWRCILRNGTPEFYGDLLLGNVCSFSIFGIELYRSYNPCS